MLELKMLATDILIIGGGTAGCFAALTIAEQCSAQVLIAEKAQLKRSGCLAAGVNALNAYLNPGETPESYVEYVKEDSAGIIREDLVYTIAKKLNQVTFKIASLGLPILLDQQGNYLARGKRSIKINGENLKPILAQAVAQSPQIQVLNRVNIFDYILQDRLVIGAYGFSLEKKVFYAITAKAVICATGGASGLYKPNNPGFSRHKLWYCPFNTGAGYAMGIRAGAEMTTMEMRFIALRCKDTIAPTGTIAQGLKAKQINSQGVEYLTNYGRPTTPIRLAATIAEEQQGRGPCYLQTAGISKQQEEDLYKAYLNMAPAQTLRWVEQGQGPSIVNVELEGTEPYIVGGHTGSGYWVDTLRATTLKGLFAAGDVAGGSPKKYVTGCFAEGEIAAHSAVAYIQSQKLMHPDQHLIFQKLQQLNSFFQPGNSLFSISAIEEAMQKVMDEYAGGISARYKVNAHKLAIARQRLEQLSLICNTLKAEDLHQLLFIQEIIDRLVVGQTLIAHLAARQETRWPCYQENADYPRRDDINWLKYVNSRTENGQVKIIFRALVRKDERYEH